MNFNKTASNLSKNTGGIQIKLNAPAKPAPVIQKSTKISNVFNADEDSDPEEMPEYAKMRMRNIGKDTPTSSGPNSFGKTKQGNKTFILPVNTYIINCYQTLFFSTQN